LIGGKMLLRNWGANCFESLVLAHRKSKKKFVIRGLEFVLAVWGPGVLELAFSGVDPKSRQRHVNQLGASCGTDENVAFNLFDAALGGELCALLKFQTQDGQLVKYIADHIPYEKVTQDDMTASCLIQPSSWRVT
jgi:hypothetical protein